MKTYMKVHTLQTKGKKYVKAKEENQAFAPQVTQVQRIAMSQDQKVQWITCFS